MCAVAAILVALCALMQSITALAVARFASGAAVGWIVPISIAYIGDVTSYEHRQPILARYLSGQICGQLFGQAAGGVLGDLLGWRNVFFLLAGGFGLAAAALTFELLDNPRTRNRAGAEATDRGFAADYRAVFSSPWARFVIFAVFMEASAVWGAFAYVGAYLRVRFGLGLTLIGMIVATFGVGGLVGVRPPHGQADIHRQRSPSQLPRVVVWTGGPATTRGAQGVIVRLRSGKIAAAILPLSSRRSDRRWGSTRRDAGSLFPPVEE